MNILFLTEKNVFPPNGGAARITVTLSKEFEKRGHKCYHCFGKSCLSVSELDKILRDNNIDIVISNLVTIEYKKKVLPAIYKLTRGRGIKVFACFHAMPGEELIGNSIKNSIYRLLNGGDIIRTIKDIIIRIIPEPIIKFLFSSRIKKRYRVLRDNSDKVVLLSNSHIEEFAALGNIPVDEKLIVIHNSLSFNYFLKEEELCEKQREVMLLSRMDEKSKKISDALRIWKGIISDPKYNDWMLTIVGSGIDLNYFKKMARRIGLERVSFEGRQEDEVSYYKRASIFMMTSAYEGWGITLTEAQQMGVVPIAFDSYSSLRDIIEDGKNGVIVKDRDLNEYIQKLKELMDNKERRDTIAKEAIASSHRFSSDLIMDKWESLFTL